MLRFIFIHMFILLLLLLQGCWKDSPFPFELLWYHGQEKSVDYMSVRHLWTSWPAALYIRLLLMQTPRCSVSCGFKVNLKVVVLCVLNHVQLFVTPWTVAHQAPLSVEFSRQEYWSELPFPSPEESSWPRDGTRVSCISCGAGRFFTTSTTWEAQS